MHIVSTDVARRVRMAAGAAALGLLLAGFLAGPAAAQTAVTPTATPTAAQPGPSAAGLWQKTEDGKPDGWFLVVDRDGSIFEGAIAKLFMKPGEDPNVLCTKCTD